MMTSDRPLTDKGDLQTFCQSFEVGAETRVTEGAEGPAGGNQGVWVPGPALTLCDGGWFIKRSGP